MFVCRLVWVLLNLWTGGNNTGRLCMFADSFEGFLICGLGVIIRAIYISLPAPLGGFEFVDWGYQYESFIFVCRLVWELLNLWAGSNNNSRLYLFAGSFGSF